MHFQSTNRLTSIYWENDKKLFCTSHLNDFLSRSRSHHRLKSLNIRLTESIIQGQYAFVLKSIHLLPFFFFKFVSTFIIRNLKSQLKFRESARKCEKITARKENNCTIHLNACTLFILFLFGLFSLTLQSLSLMYLFESFGSVLRTEHMYIAWIFT